MPRRIYQAALAALTKIPSFPVDVYNTHTGLSAQPVYGGPIYFIRNEGFGLTHLNFKWNNFRAGIVAYHNTLARGGSAFNTPYCRDLRGQCVFPCASEGF